MNIKLNLTLLENCFELRVIIFSIIIFMPKVHHSFKFLTQISLTLFTLFTLVGTYLFLTLPTNANEIDPNSHWSKAEKSTMSIALDKSKIRQVDDLVKVDSYGFVSIPDLYLNSLNLKPAEIKEVKKGINSYNDTLPTLKNHTQLSLNSTSTLESRSGFQVQVSNSTNQDNGPGCKVRVSSWGRSWWGYWINVNSCFVENLRMVSNGQLLAGGVATTLCGILAIIATPIAGGACAAGVGLIYGLIALGMSNLEYQNWRCGDRGITVYRSWSGVMWTGTIC